MELPHFRYHPDPIKTGSVKVSARECIVCGETRGYIYSSHAYSRPYREYTECICPWCIADGSAHRKLRVRFCQPRDFGMGGLDVEVPISVVREIVCCTPGFSGWQQEHWLTHCCDAMAFLGSVGYEELREYGPDAMEAIWDSTGITDAEEWVEFFEMLRKYQDGAPTAYLFRCLHCGWYDGYTDTD